MYGHGLIDIWMVSVRYEVLLLEYRLHFLRKVPNHNARRVFGRVGPGAARGHGFAVYLVSKFVVLFPWLVLNAVELWAQGQYQNGGRVSDVSKLVQCSRKRGVVSTARNSEA
jgi:hypothetical protein